MGPKKRKVREPQIKEVPAEDTSIDEDAPAEEARPRLRGRAAPSQDSEGARLQPGANTKRSRRRIGEAHPSGLEGAVVEADLAPSSPTRSQDLPAPAIDDHTRRDFQSLMQSVVKIFATHSEPNFSLPWQRKRQFASSGSGFSIPGRRILTNAHCVEHATQVKVRRRGSETKFIAKVICVGTECDIAMLTVSDESFWEGMPAVSFGELPKLQDPVVVIGFPIGGDSLSVTSGVVSRIEVTVYAQSTSELLGVQIDAAINSGNSGGPAFNSKGECVGIAFQSFKHDDAESIGYIIPTPVIEHFATDYERNGRYTAFPNLGVDWQKLESPHLRKALGMKPSHKGVRVRRVDPTAPIASSVQAGDILLSFDGVKIANDGTVPFRSGEHISFSYLISQKYTNDTAKLKLLRNGKEVEVQVPLVPYKRLIPHHIHGRVPPYFIVAGLVFTQVTVPFLRSEYGKDYEYDSPISLLDRLIHGQVTKTGQEVVVLAQVLASDISIGYEDMMNTVVKSINGQPVNSLPDLVKAVEACKEPFLRFDLDHCHVLALETKAARTATPGILAMHCVPFDRSQDLRDATNQAKAQSNGDE